MRKRPTQKRKARPNEQHAVLVRLPRTMHTELVERAQGEERSTVAHIRFLIEQDLKEAA